MTHWTYGAGVEFHSCLLLVSVPVTSQDPGLMLTACFFDVTARHLPATARQGNVSHDRF